MGERRAEHGHHGIANVLVNCAAGANHDAVETLKIASKQSVHLFGIERLREPRVAAEIGKQHGHGPPFGFAHQLAVGSGRGACLRQRPTAAAAIGIAGLGLKAARGTDLPEPATAGGAEAPTGAVLGMALRASHRSTLA
jgi:hypothetical protein